MTFSRPTHLFALRPQRAFTLIETIVSISVASILLIGMGSTVLIATQAMPDVDSPQTDSIATAIKLEQFNTELQTMLELIEHTPTAITFTVPDRNNDANPERIRYAWDATKGAPLTRQLNQNTPATFLDEINNFNLAYETSITSQWLPGAAVEDASESLLVETGVADHYHIQSVVERQSIGQLLQPALLPNALSYRPTRLAVYTEYQSSASGGVLYHAQLADAQAQPFGDDLVAATFDQNDLTKTFAWLSLPFATQTTLGPTDAIALLIDASTKYSAVNLQSDRHDGAGRLTSSDQGATWQYLSNKSIRARLYGTVFYRGDEWKLQHETLRAVNVSIRGASAASVYTHSAVTTLNTPQLLLAKWKVDFTRDPTAFDLNADAISDWEVVAGSGQPAAEDFIDNQWNARHVMRTQPDNNFTEPLTLTASIRDTVPSDNSGPALELYIDRAANTHGLIHAEALLQPDNTQTLTVQVATGVDLWQNAVVITQLSEDFIDLKIIVEPDQDLFYVEVNGVDRGAFAYTRFDGFAVAAVLAGQQTPGAQFDSIHIEVKE